MVSISEIFELRRSLVLCAKNGKSINASLDEGQKLQQKDRNFEEKKKKRKKIKLCFKWWDGLWSKNHLKILICVHALAKKSLNLILVKFKGTFYVSNAVLGDSKQFQVIGAWETMKLPLVKLLQICEYLPRIWGTAIFVFLEIQPFWLLLSSSLHF